jgi:hypothetical protein
VATGVLAIASILQVIDTSQPWRQLHEYFGNSSTTWPTPLRASFWGEAGAVYSKLRIVPLVHHLRDYETWAFYAGSHGMATDATYLARIDPIVYLEAAKKTETAVRSGSFDRDTLYVMDKRYASLARQTKGPLDVLVEADGFYALAPGWNQRRGLRPEGGSEN